jgi:hypothetical protein
MENGSTFPYCRKTTKTDGVTQKGKPARDRMCGFKGVGRLRRQIHGAAFLRPDNESFGSQSGPSPAAKKSL